MFRLRVLGGFALQGPDGAPVSALPHRRAMAVLAVLAVNGDLGCTRERLLALLWPESDEAHARHGLRDALHAIRHALLPDSISSIASLLRLDPSVVDSDVLLFSQAVTSGRLTDAVRAYGGPLLDGFHLDDAPEFENWLAGERARLARECVEALEELATSAEESGARGDAARWWARALEHDPLNSHFVLHQMRALSAIGDRANAIQAGELHVHRLRGEFGLEPDPSVFATIERIRGGDLPMDSAVPRREAVATPYQARANHRPPEPVGHDRIPTPALPVSVQPRRWPAWIAGIAGVVMIAAAIGTARWSGTGRAGVRPPRTAIAVLPFHSLTADTSQAWFAVGLHDELLTQLAKVTQLRVIGSASVSGYQRTSKSLDQIGAELAVGSILQGSVQLAGNRLRVAVQLIDPATQAHLWAETYDRPLDDAFAVQSDIAQRIVSAVGVRLSDVEAGSITGAPTANAEAYLLYLQGLEYAGRPGEKPENLTIAARLHEQALRLDSTFALAHAALSTVHATMLYRRYDDSPSRAELQLREAQAALRFAPDLPQAHLAMALAYCCGRASDRRALQELTAAARHAPSDPSVWAEIAGVQARLGNWDSADVAFDRALRLDPRNANLLLAQGNRLHCRRRYTDAIATYRQALVYAPDYIQPHIALAWSYILWKGEVDTLRTVLRGMVDVQPGGGAPSVAFEQATMLLLDRRPDSVLALLRSLRGEVWTSGESFVPRLTLTGGAHQLLGHAVEARVAYDSAAVLLDSALRAHPDDARVHMTRGGIMADLGRRADALREVRWLEQSDGYRNVRNCPMEPEARALILVSLGETDSALAAIERLLAGTSRVTVHTLRLDPLWDKIRSDARFQALLVKYANPGT